MVFMLRKAHKESERCSGQNIIAPFWAISFVSNSKRKTFYRGIRCLSQNKEGQFNFIYRALIRRGQLKRKQNPH